MAKEDGYCSKKSKSKSCDSGIELSNDELSLDEIQRYLMERMPKDAWRKVCCEPSLAIWKTRMPPKTPEVINFYPHYEDGTAADGNDKSMSVISDITEATIFPDSNNENQARRQAIGKNVVKTSCLAPERPSFKILSRRLDFTAEQLFRSRRKELVLEPFGYDTTNSSLASIQQ
jgi:hypothetical protein